MKITEIQISGFGKLSSFYMDFSEGVVDEIIENNGYGKSTIAAFIRVMLFGFENDKRNIRNSERKYYRPRNNAQYGGRLYYKTEVGSFCLSRTFGLKPKEDITELKDCDTGLKLELDDGESVGRRIFGIDSESFMRSAYLGQGQLYSCVTPEIQSKAHIEADPVDVVNYEEKIGKLRGNLKEITGNGQGALIKSIRKEINELDIELRKENALEEKELGLEAEIRSKSNEKEQLIAKRNELRDMRKKTSLAAERIQIKRAYSEKKEQMSERETEYIKASAFFKNGVPRDEEIVKILELMEQCEENETRVSQLESSSHEDMELMERPGIRGFIGLPTLFGALVILLGIALFIQGEMISGETLVFAGLIGIVYGVIKGLEITKTADDFNLRMKKSSETKRLRMNKLKEQTALNKEEIATWLEGYGFEEEEPSEDFIRLIQRKKTDALRTYHEFDIAMQRFQSYCADIDINLVKEDEDTDTVLSLDSIEEQIALLDAEIEDKTGCIMDLKREHEETLRQITELDVLKEKRERLLKKEESAKDYTELTQKTIDYLSLAKESFTNKYTHPIMERFHKHAVNVFGDKAYSFEMDANLRLSVRDGAMNYGIDSLSAGEQDLTFLLLRSALLDVMYPTEKPFIIMDDPFVNLDDINLVRAKRWINAMAKDYQIIYFCCSSARKVST